MMTTQKSTIPKRFWDDREWVYQNYMELEKKYPNKWIAVFKGRIISSGDIPHKVRKLAEKKTPARCLPVMFIEKGTHIYATAIRD